jgi:hypothetical protein
MLSLGGDPAQKQRTTSRSDTEKECIGYSIKEKIQDRKNLELLVFFVDLHAQTNCSHSKHHTISITQQNQTALGKNSAT